MTYHKRAISLIGIDALLVNIAVFGSFYLRFEGNIPAKYYSTYYHTAIASTIVFLISFYYFGMYRRIWQYASTGELLSIIYASSLGSLVAVSIVWVIAPFRVPIKAAILLWLLTLILIGGSRFIWRIFQENVAIERNCGMQKRVLIVGAGNAGVLAVRELRNGNYKHGRPVGFIDDALQKQRLELLGLPVLGTRDDIATVVRGHNIDEVIIAMPSASGDAVREVVEICETTSVKLKILPGVYDILSGNVTVKAIRDVEVEDLLGREPVVINLDEIAGYLRDETVLVTGAGGSIGSEICRQIAKFQPGKLVLLGHGENSIFDIEQELLDDFKGLDLATAIIDVKDKLKIDLTMKHYKPSVVFHAAAHKHVPLMERNPEEALKNNVLGTKNLAEAAAKNDVKTFVLISTDKAVNPTSIMGASKRMAEMVVQSMDKVAKTKFVTVRFGNVLGSRGSVIPTFKKQIDKGGPITITHPEMVRYFMTIPEAAQLVIQAGAMANGGEVFILDMGKPVKIIDLAQDLIRLSGLEVGRDIKIKFSGIRPGEKLYEELLTAEEGTSATRHKRIFVAKPTPIEVDQLERIVYTVREHGSLLSPPEVVDLIQTLLPEFRNSEQKVVANN
ncbi:MAG: nucleoside-diphosphate sugar epimerase/dehydratase [Peptococcaceae bacterium]|nr:nucleoside-diphosphate sugar epimerase/dehydratase [Peptococcaceae bacterium]